MCPNKTFKNWGSSSMDVFLRIFPSPVIRESLDCACFSSDCSLTTIVLNLKQGKVFLLSPVRFWIKKTGPFELSLISRATKGNIVTLPIMITMLENTMSNIRLASLTE